VGTAGIVLPNVKARAWVRFNQHGFPDAKEALFYIEMPFKSVSAESVVVMELLLRVMMYLYFTDLEWVYRPQRGDDFAIHK